LEFSTLYRNRQAGDQSDDFIKVFVVSVLNEQRQSLNTLIIAKAKGDGRSVVLNRSSIAQHSGSPQAG
jgi:hypothetical protein